MAIQGAPRASWTMCFAVSLFQPMAVQAIVYNNTSRTSAQKQLATSPPMTSDGVYMMKAVQQSCLAGSDITSLSECQEAAESLGYGVAYSMASGSSGSLRSMHYCIWGGASNDAVYFNPDDGVAPTWGGTASGQTAICQRQAPQRVRPLKCPPPEGPPFKGVLPQRVRPFECAPQTRSSR